MTPKDAWKPKRCEDATAGIRIPFSLFFACNAGVSRFNMYLHKLVLRGGIPLLYTLVSCRRDSIHHRVVSVYVLFFFCFFFRSAVLFCFVVQRRKKQLEAWLSVPVAARYLDVQVCSI